MRLHRQPIMFGLLVLLQAVVLPWLGDWSIAGKLYALAAVVLPSALLGLRNRSELRLPPAFWPLVALTASFSLSLPGALHWPTALIYFAVLLLLLLLFLLVTNGVEIESGFDCLVKALLCGGVVFALFGLYEYLSFLLLGPSRGMLIPYLLPPNVAIRVGGVYGQPNLFALFLALAILAFFYFHLHLAEDEGPALVRYLPLGLVGVVFFLTGSRAGFLSLGSVLFALIWLLAKGRYAASPILRKLFLRCCLVLLLSFLIASNLHHLRGVMSPAAAGISGVVAVAPSNFQSGSSANDERILLWTSAVLAFMDHPISGCGLGGFQFALPHYALKAHDLLGFLPVEAMVYATSAHNELLQVLCEGGLLAFAALLWVFARVFLGIRAALNDSAPGAQRRLYVHLLMVPIILQSMLGGALRAPGLVALFIVLYGLAAAESPRPRVIVLSPWRKIALSLALFLAIGSALLLLGREVQLGSFYRELGRVKDKPAPTLIEFERLAADPFLEHSLLHDALPRYATITQNGDEQELAVKLLPYARRLVEMQGAQWQWYTLAVLSHAAGDTPGAADAVQRAIDLQPDHQASWQLQHLLHMEEAARKTGRPLHEFEPIPPKGMR